jgi:hypothetical protein
VWIHQIHAAGGASGSITMVVMIVVCLGCVFGLSLVVCKKVPEHNLKVRILPYYKVKGITFWPTHVCTIPLILIPARMD